MRNSYSLSSAQNKKGENHNIIICLVLRLKIKRHVAHTTRSETEDSVAL